MRPLIPAILWGAFMVWLLVIPPSQIPHPDAFEIPHSDKLAHGFLFGVLGLLLYYGFHKNYPHYKISRKAAAYSLFIGVTLGGITEWIQHCCLSYRQGDIWDAVANIFGTVFGIVIMIWVRNHRKNQADHLEQNPG